MSFVGFLSVSGLALAVAVLVTVLSVVAGSVRYGEMEKLSDTEVSFPCGQRHDEFMRLLLGSRP